MVRTAQPGVKRVIYGVWDRTPPTEMGIVSAAGRERYRPALNLPKANPMKLRYLLVALALAATSACQSSPTGPDTSTGLTPTGSARRDDAPTADPVPTEDTVNRGSGWAGNGN